MQTRYIVMGLAVRLEMKTISESGKTINRK